MKRFIILSTLLLWVVLGSFVLFYVNRPVTGVNSMKADYSLASAELYNQFSQNENAANQKYLGKVIELSGKVSETGTDENGQVKITLDGDDMFGVSCTLNKGDAAAAQKIQKGDVVKVKGVCSGKLMDVVMVNCGFEKI